ncbi:MAG: 4Fe-4S binding protein [Lentisphaeria bacterium]|nr:4Fe-4S binding protein [Lentisphaeria bacterium]
MNTLKQELIDVFTRNGADLVRFGSAGRFEGEPVRTIFPGTRTVIGAAFRVLRGSRRGIEEGSTYYQYTTMGVETLEETVMPMALLRACAVLEDRGFEALPQRRNQTVMQQEEGTNPEVDFSEVYRGRAAENQLDFEACAVLCGLGERGFSGSLLTDDFGPFQRWVFLLTDAELEPDPVVEPHLCDKCRACVRACPGHALSEEGTRDRWQCAAYYIGANMHFNPFMPPEAFDGLPEKSAIITGEAKLTPERAREVMRRTTFYPPVKHSYLASICGRACDTACYIHLEEKGVLKRRFLAPFRRRPAWKLPLVTG